MNSETRKPGNEVEVWFFKIPGFLASEFFPAFPLSSAISRRHSEVIMNSETRNRETL
jgi:hypothetical protein